MKKIGRKLIAGVLTIIMLALTACGGGNISPDSGTTSGTADKKAGKETSDGARGRYLEEEIALQGVSGILTMQQLDDGTIRVIASTGIYDSADDGKTFTYVEESKAILGDYEISTADCSSSGEMVMQRATNMEEGASSYSTEYIHVDANFNVTSLEMNIPNVVLKETIDMSAFAASASDEESGGGELTGGEVEEGQGSITSGEISDTTVETEGTQNTSDLVTGIYILPNKNYLVYTTKEDIYQVDKNTGEVVTTYSNGEYFYEGNYAVIDNQLIVYTGESFSSFDFESGTITDTDAVLTGFLMDNICVTQDEESLYYVNNNGIYRYTLGTEVTEEIVNAALNSLSNPEYFFSRLLKTDDNEFYVVASTMWGTSKILKYTYSADALTTPSQEVKIYSLKDNDNIRQAISVYQKNNLDIYASLEIGMPEGSSATAADAIRTLNTKIVAGTGPDILILDGLPIDSYVEKDSLVDLAEVIKEVSKSESLFENIVNTYEKDGSVYAIPTKFTVDLIAANNDILSSYGDLNGLADKAEAYKASSEGNIINLVTAKELVIRLYETSSGSWENEDGTLDKKSLTEFVTALEKIYQTIDKDIEGEMALEMKGNDLGDTAEYVIKAFVNDYPMSVIPLSSLQSLMYVTSIVKHMENANYALLSGQTANSYIPMTTVGLSAKSENQDVAKDFIKALLSAQIQETSVNAGIPVNKTAYDSIIALSADEKEDRSMGGMLYERDDGTSADLHFIWPEDEAFESLKISFELLEIASNTNSIIKEAVVEETVLGLEAGTPVDDIVAKILTTVNLYLSE